jgi:hypothetical protein
MSADFTFLGQFQLELAVRIRQFPVLAHQVMEHIGACVVHALQKVLGLERLLRLYAVFMLLKTRHRCCAPIPALGD